MASCQSSRRLSWLEFLAQQTALSIPNKGWFPYFRFYAPWQLNDIEQVK